MYVANKRARTDSCVEFPINWELRSYANWHLKVTIYAENRRGEISKSLDFLVYFSISVYFWYQDFLNIFTVYSYTYIYLYICIF
jgi:hypothetical protein